MIVDIAIDQGGIFETEDRVTTHDDPTYIQEKCDPLCCCQYAWRSSTDCYIGIEYRHITLR